jgi:hypothetical protein
MTLLPTPTWDTFLRTVSTRTNGTWLFRGQAGKKWPLSPSAGRDQCVGSAGYRRADEYNLLKDFVREAKRYVESGFSELEWLALAQHHGLPTRLLDWSTNPLVAAWFACEKEENTDDGVVHMINVPSLDRRDDILPFDPRLSDVALVQVPPRVGRITAQQGLFSLHPDPTAKWTPGRALRYHTLEIPGAEKPFFRQALDAFGVNRGRLMIDLDGLCATLSWKYRTRL